MGNNSQQFKWILYGTICTENRKLYLGVHKTKTPYEFDNYIGGGWEIHTEIKHPQTAYEFALKKYGYNKFIRFVIRVFDNEKEAYEFEKYLVDLEFIKRRDTYNTSLGGKGGGLIKEFYQYDLNGKYIKTWDTRQDILDHYNLRHDVNRINRAVVNKWSAFDSFWTTDFVEKLDITEYRISKFSTIYCYTSESKLYKEYSTAKDVANDLNVSVNFVNEAVNKKIPIAGKFLTKDPSKIDDIIKIWTMRSENFRDTCVSIYDNNKCRIETFQSLIKLSKYLNVSIKILKNAINQQTMINNYYICYGFSENYTGNRTPALKVGQYDLEGNLVKIWNSISECSKEHPKVRNVLSGYRNHTHGYTFKIVD